MPTPILGLPYPVSSDTADVPRDIKALADKIDPLGVVPVGALCMWPTAIAPNAWLLCDGHAVLAADYPALAAVLGSQGGQITLPNLANRVPMGPGENVVGTPGGAKEVTLTALQSGLRAHGHGGKTAFSDTNLNHQHSFTTSGGGAHYHSPQVGGWGFVIATGSIDNYLLGTFAASGQASIRDVGGGFGGANLTNTVPDHTHIGSTDLMGGVDHRHAITAEAAVDATTPHSNEQRFLVVNFIIRAL